MNRPRIVIRAVARLLALAAAVGTCRTVASAEAIDLSQATVVVRAAHVPVAEETAAVVLVEEIERRTGRRLRTSADWPPTGPALVIVSGADAKAGGQALPDALARDVAGLPAEGFRLRVDPPAAGGPTVVWLAGSDARGALFAVGHLLRQLECRQGSARLAAALDIRSSPAYALRGHQLGYRGRANSYDAWDARHFEQYIRELALLGANCVEGVPFQGGDRAPLMPLARDEMNVRLSEICQRYDQDYWLWTPIEKDLSDAALRAAEIERHAALYRACPRLDAVFVPGGDPGDNDPQLVLPFLAEAHERLRVHHPRAKMWLSMQGFSPAQVDYVHGVIDDTLPDWLGGIVSGPSSPPIASTRRRLPARYPIRHYPDLTHTTRCQFPAPWWDPAFALTLGREPVNPQPMYQALLHNAFAPDTIGFLSYSDGAHDDVNKAIWTRRAWDPQAQPRDIVIEYARLFFGPDVAESAADGILALERNWEGSLAENGGVDATLALWQRLEAQAPELADNWRWQFCLLRAYYDAYQRHRLLYETGLERRANAALAAADDGDPLAAMARAAAILAEADGHPVRPDLRARIEVLCDAAYASIRLQTSVPRHGASAPERGCVLDFLDRPLNNRWWLEDEFARLRAAGDDERRARLQVIRTWEEPGEGSYYDEVGHPARSPHVLRGEGLNTDPAMRRNPNPGFMWWEQGRSRRRLSWMSYLDWPLAVVYDHVDPHARYVVRATGYRQVLLSINGQPVRPTLDGQGIGEFKEFAVPPAAVATGKLTLTFERPAEPELNWREQSRLCEIWLLKQ